MANIRIKSLYFFFCAAGLVLPDDHPGAQLSRFSATIDGFEDKEKAAYAFLIAAKELSQR